MELGETFPEPPAAADDNGHGVFATLSRLEAGGLLALFVVVELVWLGLLACLLVRMAI